VFELRDRDGFARLGRLTTPHGLVETPALLPVVHPDPDRQGIPPGELFDRFGVRMAISSSYLLFRDAALRARAEALGLHRFLGFPGAIMTDSGAFQQHSEGSVTVSPAEILRFQTQVGSDVATVLDVFGEPGDSRDRARSAVEETLRRAREARELRGSSLLAVPVQGGLHPDLRAWSAREGAPLADVQAVGGIVPLLERYRFPELVRVLAAVRPHLAPEKPVHLFGVGHPMLFSLGALWGGDLFDSSSYHKFALRDTLLFPEGSLPLSEVKEEICGCALCREMPLATLSQRPLRERQLHLTRHNLDQCLREIARVRQAIRDGTLWELAERRTGGHPALYDALEATEGAGAVFLPVEPYSRRAFRYVSPLSLGRPTILRWSVALERYTRGRGPRFRVRPRPLSPQALRTAPSLGPEGAEDPTLWVVQTLLGEVPLELTEVYPVGPSLLRAGLRSDPPLPEAPAGIPTGPVDPSEAWTRRHVHGLLEWVWGRTLRERLVGEDLRPVHSRTTGRLRRVLKDGSSLLEVGLDGLPHLTFQGGSFLRPHLPYPAGRVVAAEEAAAFVAEGRSLFSRHVLEVDPETVPGSPVLVVDASDRLLAVGRAMLSSGEMSRWARGVAVRVTAHARAREPAASDTSK
jgi:7-cyano-7-deazaguanine tRNA-ribosyltransferase